MLASVAMPSRATLLFLAACSSPSSRAPAPAPAPALRPGVLDRGSTIDHDTAHIYAIGHAVALGEIPMLDAIGLPVSGTADVDVDLHVPIVAGHQDFRHATGHAKLSCTSACTLGDDVAKLVPHTQSTQAAAFAGDGIQFGHLTFTKLQLEATFADGHADITRWIAESPDVVFQLGVHFDLAEQLERSMVTGCVRFKPTPALAERDPHTNAVLATTGAPLAPDGLFTIKLEGRADDLKRLGVVCGPADH